jgi:hypothetical protein
MLRCWDGTPLCRVCVASMTALATMPRDAQPFPPSAADLLRLLGRIDRYAGGDVA